MLKIERQSQCTHQDYQKILILNRNDAKKYQLLLGTEDPLFHEINYILVTQQSGLHQLSTGQKIDANRFQLLGGAKEKDPESGPLSHQNTEKNKKLKRKKEDTSKSRIESGVSRKRMRAIEAASKTSFSIVNPSYPSKVSSPVSGCSSSSTSIPCPIESIQDFEEQEQSLDLTKHQPSRDDLSRMVKQFSSATEIKVKGMEAADVVLLLSNLKNLNTVELWNIELTPRIVSSLLNLKLRSLVIGRPLVEVSSHIPALNNQSKLKISEEIFNQLSQIRHLKKLQLESIELGIGSLEKFHNWVCQIDALSLKFCVFPKEWSNTEEGRLKEIISSSPVSVKNLAYFSDYKHGFNNPISRYFCFYESLISIDLLSFNSDDFFEVILISNKNLKKVRLTDYMPNWYKVNQSCCNLKELESLTLCHYKTLEDYTYCEAAQDHVYSFWKFFCSMVVPSGLQELKIIHGIMGADVVSSSDIQSNIYGAIIKKAKDEEPQGNISLSSLPNFEVSIDFTEFPLHHILTSSFSPFSCYNEGVVKVYKG